MPVTMTLANDVTGTDTNGNPVRYTRGTVISKLDGRNAKVVMPYSHTYFKADSNIQIEVSPAEEATYQVTYHVADGYRVGYTLTGNGASGLDYTRYSQWCSSRFTSFGVWPVSYTHLYGGLHIKSAGGIQEGADGVSGKDGRRREDKRG